MDVKEKILLTVVMTRSKVLKLEAAAFREIAAMMDEEPPGSIALPPSAQDDRANLNGYNCYGQTDPAPLANPEGPLFTEFLSSIQVATTAPEEPSTTPAAPEAPPAPMPAEDPGPAPRRRGRPRKAVTDDATPSLLPHSEPPAAPAEVAEPAEPVESVTDAPQDMADDLPW